MNIPTPSELRKITITDICVYAVDENGEKHKIDITGFQTILPFTSSGRYLTGSSSRYDAW